MDINTYSIHIFSVWIFCMILTIVLVDAQYAEEGYEDGGYNGGNSNYNSGYEVPVVSDFLCYDCSYEYIEGHADGEPRCMDPFDGSGVPSVTCSGTSSCKKRYFQSSGSHYSIHRECVQNCKDHEYAEGKGYIECCRTSLCNGAVGSSRRAVSETLLLITAVSLCLLRNTNT